MIPSSFLNNLLPWVLQVLVIGTAGAALPRLFRIRHPRSQLIYFHFLLAVCLVLPLLQPWHHPVLAAPALQQAGESIGIVTGAASRGVLGPQALPQSRTEIFLWILAAGIVVRLCWTLAGLWQLHRYRSAAMPIYPVPESIAQARAIVKADADFCVASGVGPVTFGFVGSVVLLPESFASLDPQAQLGIACHELLHVRRNDWLMTLMEELVASLFWFHPAIWWMLGQTRLAREQLVDAEVVRLTSAPEPYINALLAIAGARPRLDLAPAPLFLHKRHLIQRMHYLLSEVSMSKLRLFCSYASMALILIFGGWAVFVSFPLVGQAVAAPAVPQAQSNTPAPSPGYVVNRAPATYPREALLKRIEGSVVVELTFNADGNITDSRVLSGPEELRQAGLQTALSGSYNISVARTLQVVVDFKLAAAAPAAQGQAGKFIADPAVRSPQGGPRGGAAPGTNPANIPSPFHGTLESITIQGLQGSDLALMQQRLQPYQGKPMTADLFKEISNAIQSGGVSVPYRGMNPSSTPGDNTALVVDFSAMPVRVRVGARVVQANLIQPAAVPVYQGIEGDVVLEAEISKDGIIENLRVISGNPLLVQAAIDAVKQWQYRPTLLNGAAVNVVTNVTVSFKAPQ